MSPFLFYLPEDRGLRGRPLWVLLPATIIGVAVCFAFFADQTGILRWWKAGVVGGALALLIIGLLWSFAEIQRVNPSRSPEKPAAEPAGSLGTQGRQGNLAESPPEGGA